MAYPQHRLPPPQAVSPRSPISEVVPKAPAAPTSVGRSSVPPPLPDRSRRKLPSQTRLFSVPSPAPSGVRENDELAKWKVTLEETVAPLRARIDELERKLLLVSSQAVVARPSPNAAALREAMHAWATTWGKHARVAATDATASIEKLAAAYSARFDAIVERIAGKP